MLFLLICGFSIAPILVGVTLIPHTPGFSFSQLLLDGARVFKTIVGSPPIAPCNCPQPNLADLMASWDRKLATNSFFHDFYLRFTSSRIILPIFITFVIGVLGAATYRADPAEASPKTRTTTTISEITSETTNTPHPTVEITTSISETVIPTSEPTITSEPALTSEPTAPTSEPTTPTFETTTNTLPSAAEITAEVQAEPTSMVTSIAFDSISFAGTEGQQVQEEQEQEQDSEGTISVQKRVACFAAMVRPLPRPTGHPKKINIFEDGDV